MPATRGGAGFKGGSILRHARHLLRSFRNGGGRPIGSPIVVYALLGGVLAGTVAQLLRQVHDPLADLGGGTAAWLSIGFLFARAAARGHPTRRGTIWAGASMVVYLFAWLLMYCFVFGLRDTAGFAAMWRDERIFEIAALPVAAVMGFIAAESLRPGVLGSACLAAPLAWSLPEVIRSFALEWVSGEAVNPPRWEYALAVGLPTLVLALLPLLRCRLREVNWLVFVAVAACGGVGAYCLLRLANHGVF